jgi:hypothetical protein
LFNYGSKKNKGPKSKKKKLSLWVHDFVCLSRTSDNKAPSSLEVGELLRAGLGRKQLSFPDDGDSSEVHSEIMAAFPKLKEGGGYELLPLNDAGGQRRELLIQSPSEGYTVSAFGVCVHTVLCKLVVH